MNTVELLNSQVADVTGCHETKGMLFGVELELEGHNVALPDVATAGWRRVQEGSLRGGPDDCIEFALSKPQELDKTKKYVNDLFKKFEANRVKLNNSIRTSTHVHLNFADKTFKQVLNFFSVFTMLEEILATYSGEDRVGNLFCISARDAEGILQSLRADLGVGKFNTFNNNRFKYSACNLSTLYKFGSIEIRTMRGANSAEQVNKWLDILNELYWFSLTLEAPSSLVKELSHLGSDALLDEIFSRHVKRELFKTFPPKNVYQSLMEGGRLIQMFAFEFDEEFKTKLVMKRVAPDKRLRRAPAPSIYTPAGNLWICNGTRYEQDREFWQDGEEVTDDNRIKWNEKLQRFIVEYPNGIIVACNWQSRPGHPKIKDERPPQRLRAMPPVRRNEFEPEEPDDFDDWAIRNERERF